MGSSKCFLITHFAKIFAFSYDFWLVLHLTVLKGKWVWSLSRIELSVWQPIFVSFIHSTSNDFVFSSTDLPAVWVMSQKFLKWCKTGVFSVYWIQKNTKHPLTCLLAEQSPISLNRTPTRKQRNKQTKPEILWKQLRGKKTKCRKLQLHSFFFLSILDSESLWWNGVCMFQKIIVSWIFYLTLVKKIPDYTLQKAGPDPFYLLVLRY